MSKEYKTIFVSTEATPPPKGSKHYTHEVNGAILSRDTEAALKEMDAMGYEFISSTAVQSTKYYGKYYTEGILMIFAKEINFE